MTKNDFKNIIKRYFTKDLIVCYVLSLVFIVSTIIVSTTTTKSVKDVDNLQGFNTIVENNYNGNRTLDKSGVLSPFVDMASWVNSSSKYYLNGTVNLGVVYDEIGCENFCLGFIRPDDTKPLESNGTIRWGWGGYYEMSEKGNDGFQYEGIKKSISNLREKGGEVVVSVGGQSGKAPWVVSQNVSKLYDMYKEIVLAYNLKRLDLDIEESNQGYEQNVANAKAIKQLQDELQTEIVLTIPVMPYGYTNTQKNLIRAYLNQGVNITMINNMTMCYGDEVNPNEDFAKASIRAIDNSCEQIKNLYFEQGVEKSVEEVYKMCGATVDIGYENEYNPIFTTKMTKEVAVYAKEKQLMMFSYWCLNRDNLIESNIAISDQYSFFEASKNFL